MLAWIHQAIPGEKENLLILLKSCNKDGKIFVIQKSNIVKDYFLMQFLYPTFTLLLLLYTDTEEKIGNCLATILDGVCRPLNVRIEQAVLSGLDCIVMNRIHLLVQFYISTIEQVCLLVY